MAEHQCDSGVFSRVLCPEPCGMMHSYCRTCGRLCDECPHESREEEADLDMLYAFDAPTIREGDE